MPNPAVDVLENILRRHGDLLAILLIDRTRTSKRKVHNIIWAVDSYIGHKPKDEIQLEDITGKNTYVIQPRIAKSHEEQKRRTRDKAEVFTPRDIVYEMNQQIDWTGENKLIDENNWKNYVSENKLEITCGEAPFIVGRYNAYSGEKIIKLENRVGFLDRKLRIVTKYARSKTEWREWVIRAYQASYGYEWQGDNLLLARENLLYTFIDYWNDKFPNDKINLERSVSKEKTQLLLEIAEIISWNIFQMDGLKYVVPMSCGKIKKKKEPPLLLLAEGKKLENTKECSGCKTGNIFDHDGTYVKIMDWEKHRTEKFVKLLKK